MNAISPRLNGEAIYRPAIKKSVWREEMLDQILSQMREQKLSQELANPAREQISVPSKGSFVDIYV